MINQYNESALLESGKDFTELEICSGLIVDSKKRVVFQCHKKDGSITFPGGKKERGESDLETLKRELKEELGIKVVSAKKLYDFTYGYNYPDDSKDYVITLEIEGKELSSEEFAEKIESIQTINPNIVFVIGGSYGLSDSVKNRSNFRLSFSDLTFPHQLFRVMLLEQIYRVFKINNNETYHK